MALLSLATKYTGQQQNEDTKWIKNVCGTLLSQLLLRPSGLRAVLLPLVTTPAVSDETYFRIAKIITSIPRQVTSLENYFAAICPQIRDQLHVKGPNAQHFVKAAVVIIGLMLEKYPQHTINYLIMPLLRPFQSFLIPQQSSNNNANKQQCSFTQQCDDLLLHSVKYFRQSTNNNNNNDSGVNSAIDVDADMLTSCLEDLHKICTNYSNPLLFETIASAIPALFNLYCVMKKHCKLSSSQLTTISHPVTQETVATSNFNTSQVIQWTQDILLTYIRLTPRPQAIAIIKNLIIPNVFSTSTSPISFDQPLDERFEYSFVMQPPKLSVQKISVSSRDFSWEAQCVVTLLKELKNESFVADLFVDLLNLFVVTNENSLKDIRHSILLHTLMAFSENLSDSVLKNVVQICLFLKAMLESVTSMESFPSSDTEDISTLCLAILEMLLSGKVRKVDKSEEILVFDLLPPLKLLQSHPNAYIATSARTLYTKIITRDQSWLKTEDEVQHESQKNFEEALKDINDPLIPVRAHGLIALRRLVLAKDAHTMKNLNMIINIFQAQLHDEESYIYLGAIRGLSAIGDVAIDVVLPVLRQTFLDYGDSIPNKTNDKKQSSGHPQLQSHNANNRPLIEVVDKKKLREEKATKSVIAEKNNTQVNSEEPIPKKLQVRLEVGEALLQISQRLGELMSKYAKDIIPIFLCGVRDADTIIQASSLSNLAEICELMGAGLFPFIEEIILTVSDIVNLQKAPESRRGAILVYTQMLRGLDQDMFRLIPHHLSTILTQLRYIQTHDPDDVCRLHASLALEELKEIVKNFVQPEEPTDYLTNLLRIVK
jgi:hypothetical protein